MTTLERQLSEYGEARAEHRDPMSAASIIDRTSSTSHHKTSPIASRVVVIVATAVVAVVAMATIFVLGGRGPSPIDPSDTPTTTLGMATTTSLPGSSALEGGKVPVQWSRATGAVPHLVMMGTEPVVSNGSSYIGYQPSGPGRSASLVRSLNGINWVEIDSPSKSALELDSVPLAVSDTYLWWDGDNLNSRCLVAPFQQCPVLITSSDGLTWESGPPSPSLHWLKDIIWRVNSVEAVLASNAPDLEPLDAFESTVMAFENQLLLLGVNHDRGDTFSAMTLAGADGWTDAAVEPPFASTLTKDYIEFGWQWMWRCEFTARDGHAMALIHDGETYTLWATVDGISWTTLPDPPQIIDGRHMCIKATQGGWLLAPAPTTGGLGIYDMQPIHATLDMIRFSSDGITWHPLEFPDSLAGASGTVEVVGDLIFLMNRDTEDVIVGVIGR